MYLSPPFCLYISFSVFTATTTTTSNFLFEPNHPSLLSMDFEDDQTSLSRSSSSSTSDFDSIIIKVNKSEVSPSSTNVQPFKKRAGRKKFKETRHPLYRGIRRRNGERWVCEIREPNKKSRIWVGTFSTPETAARAHDVAAIALRGQNAPLNFPDLAYSLPKAQSSSPSDIQIAAVQVSKEVVSSPLLEKQPMAYLELEESSSFQTSKDGQEDYCLKGNNGASCKFREFMDEEEMFNMPALINSMAEGMLITPPAMKRGFNWDDVGEDVEFNLWKD